jgi:hypothetical protein
MMMLLKFAGELIFFGGLTFPTDMSILIPADTGVDVFSDNTSHLAVSPPTTPPHQHQQRTPPGR